MNAFVVDTNVAVVAEGKSTNADVQCRLACINALENIVSNGLLVIDDRMLILQEYRKRLGLKGQPGPGKEFVKWAWDNQANQKKCERACITPVGSNSLDFAEFPHDGELSTFDRADRKFVAVSVSSRNQPKILNAVDSDYIEHQPALQNNGVFVKELCLNCLSKRRRINKSHRSKK